MPLFWTNQARDAAHSFARHDSTALRALADLVTLIKSDPTAGHAIAQLETSNDHLERSIGAALPAHDIPRNARCVLCALDWIGKPVPFGPKNHCFVIHCQGAPLPGFTHSIVFTGVRLRNGALIV